MSAAMPLRQQQARQLRTAVLEAVIAKLEGAAPDDVSNERAARPGFVVRPVTESDVPAADEIMRVCFRHVFWHA